MGTPTRESGEIDGAVGNALPNHKSVLDMEDWKESPAGDLTMRKTKTQRRCYSFGREQ